VDTLLNKFEYYKADLKDQYEKYSGSDTPYMTAKVIEQTFINAYNTANNKLTALKNNSAEMNQKERDLLRPLLDIRDKIFKQTKYYGKDKYEKIEWVKYQKIYQHQWQIPKKTKIEEYVEEAIEGHLLDFRLKDEVKVRDKIFEVLRKSYADELDDITASNIINMLKFYHKTAYHNISSKYDDDIFTNDVSTGGKSRKTRRKSNKKRSTKRSRK